MNRIGRGMAVTALVAATMVANSQSLKPKATVAKAVAGPVELKSQPDLLRGNVAAFPRVVAGAGVSADAAKKINAALQRDDARARASALDCRQSSKEAQHKAAPDAWQRTIEVTMRGPRFLAFAVNDDYYCGGAYPNFGMQMALVYDLTTGSPVNWNKLLPRTATSSLDTSSDGSNVGLVKWEELRKRSRAQADEDCKEVFEKKDDGDTLAYSLNLDAISGTLEATPATFPHVIQACAESVSLNVAALKKLGVAVELVGALEAAHALQAK